MKHLMILMVLASILVVGCGGGKAPQTLEEHKAAAANMDKTELTAKAADMLKAIDGRMPEIEAIAKELPALTLKTDDASKAKLVELKAKMATIQAERKAQAEVMAVYKDAAKNAPVPKAPEPCPSGG